VPDKKTPTGIAINLVYPVLIFRAANVGVDAI
jgi:hypothetical protein